jgi:hypothetical protein
MSVYIRLHFCMYDTRMFVFIFIAICIQINNVNIQLHNNVSIQLQVAFPLYSARIFLNIRFMFSFVIFKSYLLCLLSVSEPLLLIHVLSAVT